MRLVIPVDYCLQLLLWLIDLMNLHVTTLDVLEWRRSAAGLDD